MLYVIFLIFSCFYLSQINEERRCSRLLVKASPVILLWVLLIGGQLGIGADYNNYLAYFNHPHFEMRFEPLFVEVTRFFYNLGLEGQGLFFLYAAINAIVIFIASYRLGIRHWAIYFFLFVTVSTFFNNQMNGIRQCTAVAFVYWAFVELYNSKIKGTALILLATGFHYSAIANMAFLFLRWVTNLVTKFPKLLLILTLCLTLLPADESINTVLIESLPEEFAEEADYERMYLDNEEMSEGIDWMVKLSKILLIPIYWICLRALDENYLSPKERLYFKFGLLSYSLRCVLLINNLIGRFSYFFWIPSILPIYYYCVDLQNRGKKLEMILMLLYCSATFFLKVALGIGEYESSFIYFD